MELSYFLVIYDLNPGKFLNTEVKHLLEGWRWSWENFPESRTKRQIENKNEKLNKLDSICAVSE